MTIKVAHPITKGATLVFAAYNSYEKDRAHFICPRTGNAARIQEALDAGAGKSLVFLEGDYSIETPLRPKNKQALWVSPGSIFRPEGDNAILDLTSVDEFAVHGTLQIEDPDAHTTSAEAILFDGTAFCYFERIVIRNYYNGMRLLGTTGGTHENALNDLWMQVRNEGLALLTSCHDNKFLHVFIKGPGPASWGSGAGLRIETSGTQGGNVFANIEVLDMFRGLDLPGAFETWFGTVVIDNAYGEGLLVSGATERLFIESIWASSCGDGVRLTGTAADPLTEFNIGQLYTWLNANYGVHIGGHVEKFNFGILNANNNDKGVTFSGGAVRNGSIAQLISFANASSGIDGSGIAEDVFLDRALISDTILSFDHFTEVRGAHLGVGRFQHKGTATILAGQDNVAVAHDLSGTPSVITLGPRDAEVNGAYISARGAINFTITVPALVTADRQVDWYAEVGISLGAEKVLNGDVETGVASPDDWYPSGANAFWSTVEYKSGAHSLEIDVTVAIGDWRAEYFAAAAGQTMRVRGFFKGTGSAQMFLTIRWFSNADGTGFINEDNIPLDAVYADWTLKDADFLAPALTLSADLAFRAGGATTAHLYGDDFSVRAVH